MSDALQRLKNLTNKISISNYEVLRKENLKRLRELFFDLELDKKIQDFEDIFEFKAINLSGISLQENSLAQIIEGRYLQMLAILYDKEETVKKSKNISLRYFGRVENVAEPLRKKVVEFVVRYRFEKSFITLERYHGMINELA